MSGEYFPARQPTTSATTPADSTRVNFFAADDGFLKTKESDGSVATINEFATTNVQAASYTLTLNDIKTGVEVDSSAPTVIEVPPDFDVAWPGGAEIRVYWIGTGSISFTTGTSVTIASAPSVASAAQHSTFILKHLAAADDWLLSAIN